MSAETPISNLTSGRLLAHNTLWNLAGQLLPMAVAVLALPPLIHGAGPARFGVLSLTWVVIGYFSLFDLGIGRALTKLVADKLATSELESIPPLAWTSLLLMALLGVFAAFAGWIISPWMVLKALKIPHELQAETLHAFYFLALSIPLVTITSGFRGILEALQRFRALNFIRVPMTVFSFLGPLLVLPFSSSLVPMVVVLVLGRLVGALIHAGVCFRAMPALRRRIEFSFSLIGPVLGFGFWMNVSNLMAPIMVYLDRFLIGALLSVSALAYYTAPSDLVSRLNVLPGAIVGVLFPAFALTYLQSRERMGMLFTRSLKYIFLAIFPIVLVLVTFAPEGLRLWLGATFAQNSASALRWLAIGIFINSLAYVPFALLQATGRPRLTAAFQLLEFPPYLIACILLLKSYGITGAAVAWAARVAVDGVLLFTVAFRMVPHKKNPVLRLAAAAVFLFLILCAPFVLRSLIVRTAFFVFTAIMFVIVGWRWILAEHERAFVVQKGPQKLMMRAQKLEFGEK